MNTYIDSQFIDYQEQITNLVKSFETSGIEVGDGDRNTIKKFKLNGNDINIKSFKEPNFINQIAYQYIRKSKARRSFEYAAILKSKAIGTPNPIAFLEFDKGFGFGKSFYISEQVFPNLTYRELIHNPDYPDHEKILRAFTRFTYSLHEKGILFLDHSPGNTLIFLEDETIKFCLVDLNRMKFKNLNFKERIYNFRRLTPKNDMVEVMSDEYAKLIHKSKNEVYDLMWDYTLKFRKKIRKKKKWKNLFK